ncbi:hypothetical protein GB937_009022 [Aspergillus fischeri]|nr:hypothetical protein GB937_009022 [Aspergillus fischeri]
MTPQNGTRRQVDGGPICFFPTMTRLDMQSITFDNHVVQKLTSFPNASDAGVHLLLAGLWALTLRQYAEVDTARFEVSTSILASGKGSGATKHVFSIALSPSDPVSTLFDVRNWDIRFVDQKHSDSFNTGVFVVENQNGRCLLDVEYHDINLLLQSNRTSAELSLVYRSSAIAGTYARHLADGIAQAIISISENPNQSIGAVDFCCSLQKAQVVTWQNAKIIQPDRSFLFEYISRNATVHGDTLAIDSWDGQFTYAELDGLSTVMATRFQERGIGPGDLVPMCFGKTRWAIAAMLAINKTGAGFVPLDPAYPQSRLETIIQKTQARVALASPTTESILRPLGLPLLVISDSILGCCLPHSKRYTAPNSGVAPAYCFFTSGSTGDPKGCEVSHLAFASIATHARSLCLSQQSRSLQFASFCFGASLLEIWCTLIVGGTLCIPSDHDRLNSLGEFMAKMRINWAFITPTVLASISPDNFNNLHLFIAGEPIGERDIRTWAPRARLFQAYGLTEWAGVFAVSRQIRTPEDRKSIGSPVNARAWIVDPLDHQKLAPIGAVGELVIEGPSLAQGYRGDPQRTAAVFLQRPPWLTLPALSKDGSSSRVYKTGDLVRYAEDGSLVYVRRKDNQVKIHGQRLEIGEVEYHVRQLFPQAKMVIVMVHEPSDAASHQRNLVALTLHPPNNGHTGFSHGKLEFMEVDQEYQSKVEHVRNGLRSRLPAFMIPQLFLPLSQIPTTITGKADRRSLCRDVNKLSYAQLHGLTTQMGKGEEAIHAAVCDVLGLAPEHLGMNDNFFHLGGNSASAMKLTMSARRRGLRFTIRDVFNHPVLAELASAANLSNGCERPVVQTMELLEPESVSELKQLAVSQCRIDEDIIEDIYPSTALQEGLVAITARDPSLCKARVICKLRSNVRIDALKAAWECVVQLNDILRTRFILSASHGTFQVVCKEPFSWARAQNLEDCIQQSDALVHRVGDDLVHAYIIPDEKDRDSASTFVFVAHHALCDQWSIRLLLDQLTAAYGHSKLPSNRFSAFIRYLTKTRSHFKNYWINQFQGLEAVAFPPLPSPSYTPVASEKFDFVMKLLGNTTKQITTATYIKLAWAVVISCNTGSNDTVFGVTVNGRGAPIDGVGELTGPTIATIPQRIKLLPDQSATSALAEIQSHSLEVIPYEQAGLQNIQKYSPEARSACMFQSQLIIQPCPPSPPDLFEACDFSATQTGGFSAYGLSLECQMTHDDRHCEVTATFDPGMISRERVQRLLQHLELVLQDVMADPSRKVGDLPRMSRQDWDQIQRWSGTLPPVSRQCVHDAVDERYLEYPNACAVSAPDGDLSYAELIHSANAVAAELLAHGVEPGKYIPVLFEKCKWSPVAMLGVLKAGAAFVLLDPSYPPQRLHAICGGLKSQIILCSKGLSARAASLGPTAIAVHENATFLVDIPNATLPVVSPEDPAYVVFTSGSTGTPKGAIIDHQSYCSSALAHNRAHFLGRNSRVLQYASYAFDVSIMETLSTLMAGGCVCILSDLERHDHFADSVQRLAVTHAFLTPSTARLLMQRELPSLCVLVMGGEVMSLADRSYWMKRVRLMNEYGIAECSVASTIREVSDVEQRDIGFPMGVLSWVVDQNDHEKLVAIGAIGELLLEGPSVGRGYLDNPEATRRAFIEQPGWLRAVRGGKTSRVYKTGDLVQYNEDGSLSFIGRKDSQIKIRGQRFELEEVEQHLRRIDEIKEVTAVAVAPSDRQKQAYLVAFIVPRTRESFCVHSAKALVTHPTEEFRHLAAAIQSKLHSILPAHMVPSIYLPVNQMPKTSSDKVDRCRLKEEVGKWSWSDLQAYSVSSTSRRAPSNSVEQDLQRVWAQILGIRLDSIGVEDSFFHLGGDSIIAMQVVAEARSRGLDHSVQDINQLKSIKAIANKIGVVSTIAQPVVQDQVTDELFGLTPIQEFFFEKYPEGTCRFNQNILVHFQKPVADIDVERAANKLVQNHAILRARYARQKDGSWKQFFTGYTEQCFRFSMHKVNSVQEMRHIIGQSQTSLDPEHGPVFTVDLFDHNGQQSLFMIGHHLVLDLVSWRIILADMEAMILDPQHQPHLTMSFQTWARLQAEYGTRHLEPPPVQQLCSIDEPSMRKFWGAENNANTGGDSKTRLIRVNEQLTNKLFGPSSQALDVEPVELLHAAILFSFVNTFPQRPAPCIFGEAHGRETWDSSIDVTRTIGWFTTLWPVVAQVNPSDSLETVVRTVRQARRAMDMHGWKHFTSIYHNTQQTKCSAGTHLMEITFNYAGKFQQVEQDGALFRMEPMAKQNLFDGAAELGRWAMLEINSVILNGMLEFHVTYNRGTDEASVLTPWMDNLVKCLEDLASGFA